MRCTTHSAPVFRVFLLCMSRFLDSCPKLSNPKKTVDISVDRCTPLFMYFFHSLSQGSRYCNIHRKCKTWFVFLQAEYRKRFSTLRIRKNRDWWVPFCLLPVVLASFLQVVVTLQDIRGFLCLTAQTWEAMWQIRRLCSAARSRWKGLQQQNSFL